MAIRVGRWDCPFCGHKGNLGPEKQCTACHKPRGNDVKFYLPDDAEVVTDEEPMAQAKAGADWICDYCGAGNSHERRKCHACGNGKTESDGALQTRSYNLNEVPHSGTGAPSANKPQKQPVDVGNVIKGWGCLCVIFFFIVLFIVNLAGGNSHDKQDSDDIVSSVNDTYTEPKIETKIIDVTVSGHEWSRKIFTEKYQPVEEEDWDLPYNARLIRTEKEIDDYQKVLDHYETKTRTYTVKVGEEKYISGQKDLGNGYFEDEYSYRPIYEDREETYQEPVYRKEPIYRTKYVYEIYKWERDETVSAFGNDMKPVWPVWTPPSKEYREDFRDESNTLVVKDSDGKTYRVDAKFEDWQQTKEGDLRKLKIYGEEFELLAPEQKPDQKKEDPAP